MQKMTRSEDQTGRIDHEKRRGTHTGARVLTGEPTGLLNGSSRRFLSRLVVELNRPVDLPQILWFGSRPTTSRNSAVSERTERGYAMVAIIGVMLFSLILTTATAPKIIFETKREKEEEMLWRGQQVAAALTRYSTARSGQYPTKLDELISGIDLGAKTIRFLRPSAICDPMTPCDPGKATNWRLVHPGDPLVKELLEAYLATQMKPNSNLPPPPQSLIMFAQMAGAKINLDGTPVTDEAHGQAAGGTPGLNNGLNNGLNGLNQGQPFGNNGGMSGGMGNFGGSMQSPGFQGSFQGGGSFGGNGGSFDQGGTSGTPGTSGTSSNSGSGSGLSSGSSLGFNNDEESLPIIGVVSKKSDKMFRNYFGIQYYDHTLFFPVIPVVAGGFISPLNQTAISNAGSAPQCSGGGVMINGKCWGGLTPGILCRGPNGATIPCQR